MPYWGHRRPLRLCFFVNFCAYGSYCGLLRLREGPASFWRFFLFDNNLLKESAVPLELLRDLLYNGNVRILRLFFAQS
jgi:hypothetical protein